MQVIRFHWKTGEKHWSKGNPTLVVRVVRTSDTLLQTENFPILEKVNVYVANMILLSFCSLIFSSVLFSTHFYFIFGYNRKPPNSVTFLADFMCIRTSLFGISSLQSCHYKLLKLTKNHHTSPWIHLLI